MTADVIVIGAGIQGLIMTKYLRDRGLDARCISNTFIGGDQTLKSQFYLHRGHFYNSLDLAVTLNKTYQNWVNLFKEIGLPHTRNRSYIGFGTYDEESHWSSHWEKANLPYKKEEYVNWPDFLKKSNGYSFFKIPHILFSGQNLVEKLTENIFSHLIFGNVSVVEKINHQIKIKIYNNEKASYITTKNVIFCAGSGNNALVKMVKSPSKKLPKIQKRSCLVCTIEGILPNMSLLLPGLKMFISPQYHKKKVYWLYTYGTDPIINSDFIEEKNRLRNQMRALFDFFPIFATDLNFNFYTYSTTKIEEATEHGTRPNKAFVHSIDKGIFLVLPTKLSLSFESSYQVYNYIKESYKNKDTPFIDSKIKDPWTQYKDKLEVGKQEFLTSIKNMPLQNL